MISLSWVPWIAAPDEVVRNALRLAQVNSDDVVYDLGCGDGRILIKAMEEFGVKKAVGYEARVDIYETSIQNIQKHNLQDKVRLVNGDLYEANLSEASVITLYLSDNANELLRPKLEKELTNGTKVVSITFKMGSWRLSDYSLNGFLPAYFSIPCKLYVASHDYPIYLYTVPDAFLL